MAVKQKIKIPAKHVKKLSRIKSRQASRRKTKSGCR